MGPPRTRRTLAVMARLMLATDGSPSARAATEEAVRLAHVTAWPLTVVSVWHAPVTGFAYEPVVAGPEVADAVRDRALAVVDEACDVARAAGVEPAALLLEGVPDVEICNAARERGATMLVIGSHGWGPMHRLLFGSVSAKVLHHAPCPVLVVRAPVEHDAPV